jgi:hypothetical protein
MSINDICGWIEIAGQWQHYPKLTNEQLADLARSLASLAWIPHKWFFHHSLKYAWTQIARRGYLKLSA